MPSPYLTYALAALSFGLSVAFFRISDENSELSRAKIAIEMRLETAEGEAKDFREKYTTEAKGREFAEAAQTLAETSERAVRSQLTHETKARQAAEKGIEEAENARHSVEAALSEAQEQVRVLNGKLMEASAAKEQSERKSDVSASDRGGAAAADAKEPAAHSGDGAPVESAAPAGAMATQASMAGSRPWYSFLGLF
jgi:chromosome segregation ATPase